MKRGSSVLLNLPTVSLRIVPLANQGSPQVQETLHTELALAGESLATESDSLSDDEDARNERLRPALADSERSSSDSEVGFAATSMNKLRSKDAKIDGKLEFNDVVLQDSTHRLPMGADAASAEDNHSSRDADSSEADKEVDADRGVFQEGDDTELENNERSIDVCQGDKQHSESQRYLDMVPFIFYCCIFLWLYFIFFRGGFRQRPYE